MSRLVGALCAAWCVAVGTDCRPSFDDDPALIVSPRVLAVKSEPAEAAPGTTVAFTALLAAPSSSASALDPSWSFCLASKPVTDDNVVASACLTAASLAPAGAGSTISAVLPSDGCTLFGPDPPPGGFRPRDPDATGGYFQPLRVDLLGADPTFHLARLSCRLGEASADIATAFAAAYVANQNPTLSPLSASSEDNEVDLAAIPRGAQVELTASWSAEDVESYAYFDLAQQAIVTRREAMTVSWYTSGGKLMLASSGRSETDPELTATNQWTAPSEAGTSELWLVLRDSRGGADFASYELTLR